MMLGDFILPSFCVCRQLSHAIVDVRQSFKARAA